MKVALIDRTERDRFRVGDLVTRMGDDVHEIVSIDDEGYAMEVVCIKAPLSGWIKAGEKEYNLCRRYGYAGQVIEA